ncbi:aminoglycoside phosphotransferase family protein [Krasilnikoviella flava]|uniref:Streptomycin 6-kinase n=1 Tax=Krasilnikoviella flava TaxID=526729 RepID=A0A1T5ICI7_9MICO|nr:aminoglycoside phosphotransferase family protein [Krasilnikoviella flava]SKC36859.1 streptomycin 6-kinase [Krasilnikoviella flava]
MITVPPSFRAMPRWWHDDAGRGWLDVLPGGVAARCAAWGLVVDGEPAHGSNALVVPVRRGDERLALRLAPPGDDVAGEVRALRVWAGRGTVLLVDADEGEGATLLERLDGGRSLADEPLDVAVEVLAGLTRTLAVPAPDDVPSTAAIAAGMAESFPREWAELGEPLPSRQLDVALDLAAERGAAPTSSLAVDGDLHHDQVLAGMRAPWLVVDPVLWRGDPEADLARVLWTRLDELPSERDVVAAFDAFVRASGVPRDRARAWVVLRATSYLLWGLAHGLTEDPVRCRRLLDVFV